MESSDKKQVAYFSQGLYSHGFILNLKDIY